MKRTVFTLLYLMVATTVVFYWPKIIASFGNSGSHTPHSLAEEARMDEDAYFALREVASVQLGYVVISYEMDPEKGQCSKRFSNAACPNIETDPEELLAGQKIQQENLHRQILLLGPVADADGSGFVDREEGARFRDLYEFGHLASYCQSGSTSFNLAKAAGIEEKAAAEKLQDFINLHLADPVIP